MAKTPVNSVGDQSEEDAATRKKQFKADFRERMAAADSAMKAGRGDFEQQRLRMEKLRAERKKLYDEARARRGNADNQFGEFIDSEDAMPTASDLFQQLQSCEDRAEAAYQAALAAIDSGVFDLQEAREWVANGTAPAA